MVLRDPTALMFVLILINFLIQLNLCRPHIYRMDKGRDQSPHFMEGELKFLMVACSRFHRFQEQFPGFRPVFSPQILRKELSIQAFICF